jgi:hypothetical protein
MIKKPMTEEQIRDLTRNTKHFAPEVRDKLHDAQLEIRRLQCSKTGNRKLNQRLFDLVRYSRGFLHKEKLITDEEYAELCITHGSVQRLEDYDELIEKYKERK